MDGFDEKRERLKGLTVVAFESRMARQMAHLITAQGGTLEMALAQQGMTEEKLREQITIQKKLEKLLADKVAVTEAEIDTYIKDSKATPPKNVKMEDFRKQIGEQLKGQKFQQEAQKWVSDLTTSAKIKYYVNY